MAIYNLGSINIDHLYRLTHLPAPGETASADSYRVNPGGKGLNMSVAIARAGGELRHIGAIGAGDAQARDMLDGLEIERSAIFEVEAPTGHAVVCVDDASENSIVIFGGANRALTREMVLQGLEAAGPGDWLLMQNETNANEIGLELARAKGMRVALVAAPFEGEALLDLIGRVDLVSMNQSEAEAYRAKTGRDPEAPGGPELLLTLGSRGAVYIGEDQRIEKGAFTVEARDTTAAGDTYFGSFLARLASGDGIEAAMRYASAAAALKVTRSGAAEAIPMAEEVADFLQNRRS